MIPVLTPQEMAGVDRQAPEPVEVLVGRAGAAVANKAARLLSGVYGKAIVVVAGKGNNGADGRAAAALLAASGARVKVFEAADLAPGQALPPAQLVIDAAYGTGLQRAYLPPSAGSSPVLAVDIPSGLSGSTGEVLEGGGALGAVATVTFASFKPGLLLGSGPVLAGDIEVADIGLGKLAGAAARCWLVDDGDVRALVPVRAREAHKWQTAVQVVAGSPGMTGAPWLASRAALRAGAGYVQLSMPGVDPSALPPGELVHRRVAASGWDKEVLEGLSRVKALVIGPGLGQAERGRGRPGCRLGPGARRGGRRRPQRHRHPGGPPCHRRTPLAAHRHHPPRGRTDPLGWPPTRAGPPRRGARRSCSQRCHCLAEGLDDGGGHAGRQGPDVFFR